MTDKLQDMAELVNEVLSGNASAVDKSSFRLAFNPIFNADGASIDIFPYNDMTGKGKPLFRLLCVDGRKPDPVTLWVYWCSNYSEPENWIKDIWPAETEYSHFLSKFMSLRKQYSGDETMNRFFRELSAGNQQKLIRYISTKYNY